MKSAHTSSPPTVAQRLPALVAAERQRFLDHHPRSLALAGGAQRHFLFGVPLHWMRDWPSPATLFVNEAQGVTLQCADGLRYTDFCLGDTGAMFGHSPAPVAQALATQAARGLTCMLPAEQTAEVGALLAQTFGLPLWQLALSASDANGDTDATTTGSDIMAPPNTTSASVSPVASSAALRRSGYFLLSLNFRVSTGKASCPIS